MKEKIIMLVKCISNCSGDYYGLTIGREYKVIEEKEILVCRTLEGDWKETRIRVHDDLDDDYLYPKSCFVGVPNN
jgi:hypothetical protein